MPGPQTVMVPRQVSMPYSSPSKWRPAHGPSPWTSPQQDRRPSVVGAPVTDRPLQASIVPSPFLTGAISQSPRCESLGFDELHTDGAFFDPCQQPLKGQLLQKMRMQPNALLEPMKAGIGSCNAGMWMIRDGAQGFVLKLVRSSPAGLGILQSSEADKFAKLCRESPGIVTDASLSFPVKIFHCLSGGIKSHDLIVMRQVPGIRMSEFIMQTLHGKQVPDLMRVLERFGAFLADFHTRYNSMQHGDLTPANVFYDRGSGRFALVDVADLAPRNPVIQSDTERFTSSLKLLSHFYGPDLFMQGKAQFEAGYNANAGRGRIRTA